jgi:hypothetical protein
MRHLLLYDYYFISKLDWLSEQSSWKSGNLNLGSEIQKIHHFNTVPVTWNVRIAGLLWWLSRFGMLRGHSELLT